MAPARQASSLVLPSAPCSASTDWQHFFVFCLSPILYPGLHTQPCTQAGRLTDRQLDRQTWKKCRYTLTITPIHTLLYLLHLIFIFFTQPPHFAWSLLVRALTQPLKLHCFGPLRKQTVLYESVRYSSGDTWLLCIISITLMNRYITLQQEILMLCWCYSLFLVLLSFFIILSEETKHVPGVYFSSRHPPKHFHLEVEIPFFFFFYSFRIINLSAAKQLQLPLKRYLQWIAAWPCGGMSIHNKAALVNKL